MESTDCPQCRGTGMYNNNDKCLLCHGRKKITPEFAKWFIFMEKKRSDIIEKLRIQKEAEIEWQAGIAIRNWERFNRRPRKFPKKG